MREVRERAICDLCLFAFLFPPMSAVASACCTSRPSRRQRQERSLIARAKSNALQPHPPPTLLRVRRQRVRDCLGGVSLVGRCDWRPLPRGTVSGAAFAPPKRKQRGTTAVHSLALSHTSGSSKALNESQRRQRLCHWSSLLQESKSGCLRASQAGGRGEPNSR